MGARTFDHPRLMRASIERVERALDSDHSGERTLAHGILDGVASRGLWEREHSGLMRRVAAFRRLDGQILMLRRTALRLIHTKAVFELLRDSGIRGPQCQPVLRYFHRSRSFADALVLEHGRFLRAGCSYLCSSHLGGELADDPVFFDPMQRYEELYREYFRIFCTATLVPGAAGLDAQPSLLPLLKHQLCEQRSRILALPESLPSLLREFQIRRPTGNTVRLDASALRRAADPRRSKHE